jgi:zinc transport system substrate-binding protein
VAIVNAMAQALGDVDPGNRTRYQANARTTIGRIEGLDADLKALLAPVRTVPYIVFHDGYQYFEKRYGLNAVGSITVSPERPPGARRLGEIRRKIDRLKAACVFGEPQFETGFVRTVSEGTKARIGVLDYIGIDQEPGPDAYLGMMRGLGRSLAACLGG